jgi:hypothetical protein
MADDRQLAEVAKKIDEAKEAAEEAKRSRPNGPTDDEPEAPRQEADQQGFSPS